MLGLSLALPKIKYTVIFTLSLPQNEVLLNVFKFTVLLPKLMVSFLARIHVPLADFAFC